MGARIDSVTSAEFDALFASFQHTAYRLETLQAYDVSYEQEPYSAFLGGLPRPADQSKNEWTSMIKAGISAGKVFQRVRVVSEPLTDYLRYELEWSYPPNTAAGEDIRVLTTIPEELRTPGRLRDYWLFDSSDLWVMDYAGDGSFLCAEQVDDPALIVRHSRWRDAALHHAIPYQDYMRRSGQLAS